MIKNHAKRDGERSSFPGATEDDCKSCNPYLDPNDKRSKSWWAESLAAKWTEGFRMEAERLTEQEEEETQFEPKGVTTDRLKEYRADNCDMPMMEAKKAMRKEAILNSLYSVRLSGTLEQKVDWILDRFQEELEL